MTDNMENTNTPTVQDRLRQRLREMERSQGWLARRLGMTPGSVNAWLCRGVTPSAAARRLVEQLTGVPADAWLEGKSPESADTPRAA